jgi:uncharacterized protein YlxW (UPF0749 family)
MNTPAPTITSIVTPIVNSIWLFSAMLVVAALIAYVVAQTWGGSSRRRRQMIYGVLGFVGFVVAALLFVRRLQPG